MTVLKTARMLLTFILIFHYVLSDNTDSSPVQIFSTVFVSAPSTEITHKYLSLKIANIANYEIYLLRTDSCSDIVDYDDAPDNIHLLELNSKYRYADIREMITSNNIDLWLSSMQENCIAILSNDEIMNKLKSMTFSFSIIQTWDLCGTIISDVLNLKRIDFQVESFMYPMLHKMYDFIYYDSENIIPKSGSDATFDIQLLTPFFNKIREDFNVSIPTQQESWDTMTTFLWIPSIPGYEYPNYLLPRIQFIGAIRSERNKYLSSQMKDNHIIQWLDTLSSDKIVIFFSFGTLWHNMQQLNHRDEQLFNVLRDILRNEKYHIIFKSVHRHQIENELLSEYGGVNSFKFVNYTEWIPQTMIVSHERVKLLVSHGGYGHVQEAIFHALPFISIPFQFDQPLNSEKSKRIGVSYLLNVTHFTSMQLMDAIHYVLSNQTFYQNAKAWSNAMKSYDGKSIMKFTMQAVADGISDAFKLKVDSCNKVIK